MNWKIYPKVSKLLFLRKLSRSALIKWLILVTVLFVSLASAHDYTTTSRSTSCLGSCYDLDDGYKSMKQVKVTVYYYEAYAKLPCVSPRFSCHSHRLSARDSMTTNYYSCTCGGPSQITPASATLNSSDAYKCFFSLPSQAADKSRKASRVVRLQERKPASFLLETSLWSRSTRFINSTFRTASLPVLRGTS